MERYISATKLEGLCGIMADKCDDVGESNWNQFRTAVECSPAANVVEVVRCKECEHFGGDCWCKHFECGMRENDFCSRGERKDDGN